MPEEERLILEAFYKEEKKLIGCLVGRAPSGWT